MHLSNSQKFLYNSMHKSWGEFKTVKILGGKTYKVPVYYILVHGLKAKELNKLGFEEM